MSLLHPPPNLPPHLIPIWPLIWVQAMMLRAYVRATWGKGTEYYWGVTPHGRAVIVSIVGKAEQTEVPVWVKPPAHANARIAAALNGSLFTPAHARNPLIGAHPGARRGPVRQALCAQRLDPGFRRDERLSVSLPLPDS
ncbi:MAG TPA: hypothetical protein PK417_03035 [Hyphomonas sp.]|nr:hypothetical protein [Hyphomonas sp.]HRX74107.1 hypothetical protein [Hyphomonas sp.]